LPDKLTYVTTVDLAISKKDHADDSVVLTAAMDRNDRIYIIEYKNWKADPSEVIAEIYRQQGLYDSRVAIEAVGYQSALAHYLKIEGKRRGKYLHVAQIHTRSNKETKIRGLIPLYANGLIFHPRNRAEVLEDQLKRFPSGKHDDTIDALAMSLPYLKRPLQKFLDPLKNLKMRYTKDGRPYFKK
jgi:predicted phage terminase large subunit-like protein